MYIYIWALRRINYKFNLFCNVEKKIFSLTFLCKRMLLLIENIFWSGIDIYKKVERYIYIL